MILSAIPPKPRRIMIRAILLTGGVMMTTFLLQKFEEFPLVKNYSFIVGFLLVWFAISQEGS